MQMGLHMAMQKEGPWINYMVPNRHPSLTLCGCDKCIPKQRLVQEEVLWLIRDGLVDVAPSKPSRSPTNEERLVGMFVHRVRWLHDSRRFDT